MAAPANKIAMSKALGAAFLNHQVEQLEKSVGGGSPWGGRDREPRSRRGEFGGGPRKKSDAIGSNTKATVKDDRTSMDYRRLSGDETEKKDGDVVVVDASFLVHCIDQLKKWCRSGREEIIIVPLEALNTMDILKKGSTPLAQRAREASRILEAQVGTNPRIRVQQDDAFVPWAKITFQPASDTASSPEASPEWVRRTICSARWEHENAATTIKKPTNDDLQVILATCTAQPAAAPALPMPERAHGVLVTHWGRRAGVKVSEFKPSPAPGHGRRTSSEEKDRRIPHPHIPVRRERGLVEKPPMTVIEPTKVIRVLARGEKLEPGP